MDYKRYFEKLINKAKEYDLELKHSLDKHHYINVKTINGYKFSLVVSTKNSKAYGEKFTGFIVEVYIDGENFVNKFNLLNSQKSEIDNELEDLIWQEKSPTKKVCRIFIRKEGNLENINEWDDCIYWQINKLKEFLEIFPKYINKEFRMEDIEKEYKKILTQLFYKNDNNYHLMQTVEGNKFKLIRSNDNFVVMPFTDKATPMTISLYEVKLFLENTNPNYSSYTRVIVPYLKKEKDFNSVVIINKKDMKDNKMNIKNIILYGAPGVGKTHNYKKLISLIEQGKSQNEIFDSIQLNEEFRDEDESFQSAKKEKRIEFVTFHQSFSYEDFIEGFRPQENGNIEIENGIFKLISKNAENQSFQLNTKTINFDEAYDILRDRYFENALEKTYSVSNVEIVIHEFKENTIKVQSSNAKDTQYVKKSDLEIVVKAFIKNEIDKPADIKKLDVKKDTKSLAGFYYPIGKLISKLMKENEVNEEVEKNYYLVIDEINRGNISKIFGELITLIEESKRDSYEVTLPYSKQKFSVPSNLYIIGTMNTTDKSIALIDVALRRRFTFIKMEPKSDLVLSSFKNDFEKLNKLITEHIGEDYQIGHSYFMNIDESDLDFVKKYKIKPLLEEYYYGDDRISEALNILGL